MHRRLFQLDEEGRRSVERRGWIGHYLTGAYRVTARPIAQRQVIARAKLLAYIWDMDEVSNFVERLPKRYILPVLAAFGATVGENAVLWEGVRIINGNRDGFRPLKIGRNAYYGWHITFDLASEITLGDCTAIGNKTHFVTHIDWAHTPLAAELYPPQYGPIRVGRGAFIGPNSTVTHGVTIGECAVIGAHSVVTRDIPPYTLAAGSPARVVRELDRSKIPPFNDEKAFIIPEGTTD